jgi:TonB-linked SusC/RagA family outer membrane protein
MSVTLSHKAMRWRKFIAVCLTTASLAWAGTARAQGTGSISGRVVDARTELPIAGASVSIEGTRLGGFAGADGRYRIANVPAGTHSVAARSIGFAPVIQSVTVGTGAATADFALQVQAVALDEIVVSGTASGERVRSMGNSVTKINAAEATALTAPPNITSLMNARAPGMIVNFNTGRIGSASSINIRGRSSIGQGNSPLIYVDGVRINTSTGVGPSQGGFSAQGAQIGGRLNDINPEDIESIEVIKGPAASTIYGTEASNGVIQIMTKKGGGSRPTLSLQVQQGAIWFRDPEGRIPTNYYRTCDTCPLQTWNAVTAEADSGRKLFRNGHTRVVTGAISGGFQQARYYISSSFQDEAGVEPNNSQKAFSLHANMGVTPNEKVDFNSSVHFVKLKGHLGTDLGASTMFGAIGGHILRFPASRGFSAGFPPEVSWELWDNMQNVNRFTASATVNHHPVGWFSHRLLAGIDYTNEDLRGIERFAPPELAVFLTPAAATGRIGQTIRTGSRYSFDYAGTAEANLTSSLQAATSVGLQTFRTDVGTSSLGGTGFPGAGVELISATATPLQAGQSETVNTTVGGYVQEKFSWRDRLFLTGALRVDNNSAFGEDFKWVTYPKADVSWVTSEESFFEPVRDVLTTLRLRAAYGESGQSPNAFAALRTFTSIQGPNGTNAVTPGSQGNPNLRPERSKELEVGFEAELFDRFSLDFTYYDKKTIDQIVNQPVAPSTGFPGSVPLNLARVDNSGFEVLATVHALERPNLAWTITGSLATSKDVIKDLGIVPGAISTPGGANRVGYPIGGIFTKQVVSADRSNTVPYATNVLCADTAGRPPIACAQAPYIFQGTPTPKQTGAITNTITLMKRLRLFALVDYQRGNIVWNVNELLRCQGLFGGRFCEANYFPEKYSPIYLAETSGTALNQGIIDLFYQDASYFKLREVSATYSIPERWIRGLSDASVTVVGRELHTWTDYPGIDPDFSGANDQAIIPQLSRLSVILNVRF